MTITSQVLNWVLTSFWVNASLLAFISYALRLGPATSIIVLAVVSLHSQFGAHSMVFGLQNVLATIHPLLVLAVYSTLLKQLLVASKHLGLLVGLFYSLSLTLALGGWWAFQEFTWGGWWNWDSVETPVLGLLIYLCIASLHKKVANYVNTATTTSNTALIVVLVCFSVRFGGFSSVHSFINSSTTYLIYYSALVATSSIYILAIVISQLMPTTLIIFKALSLYLVFPWLLSFLAAMTFKMVKKRVTFIHIRATIVLVSLLILNFKYLEVFYHYGSSCTYRFSNHFTWVKPASGKVFESYQHLGYLTN